MSIVIEHTPDVSLNEIAQAQREGVVVTKSGHIGNLRQPNIAVAAMSPEFLLADHHVVAQSPNDDGDKGFYAGALVTAEACQSLEIDRRGAIAMRTQVIHPETGEQMSLDTFHLGNLRRTFPEGNFMTLTDYLRAHESVAGEIVAAALDTMPDLFTRVVDADGMPHKRSFGSFASQAKASGVLHLRDDPRTGEAVLLPKEVVIVAQFVIAALQSTGTQFHLSGPAFYRYARDPSLQSKIDLLYDEVKVRSSFGSSLPDTLRVKMVPAAEARFVAPLGQEEPLRRIFEILHEMQKERTNRATFMQSHSAHSEQGQAYVHDAAAKNRQLMRELGKAAVSSGILIEAPTVPFPSSEDVRRAGGAYMPLENITLSMTELAQLTQLLQRTANF